MVHFGGAINAFRAASIGATKTNQTKRSDSYLRAQVGANGQNKDIKPDKVETIKESRILSSNLEIEVSVYNYSDGTNLGRGAIVSFIIPQGKIGEKTPIIKEMKKKGYKFEHDQNGEPIVKFAQVRDQSGAITGHRVTADVTRPASSIAKNVNWPKVAGLLTKYRERMVVKTEGLLGFTGDQYEIKLNNFRTGTIHQAKTGKRTNTVCAEFEFIAPSSNNILPDTGKINEVIAKLEEEGYKFNLNADGPKFQASTIGNNKALVTGTIYFPEGKSVELATNLISQTPSRATAEPTGK